MTLRIVEQTNAHGSVLTLHGWLSLAEVDELAKVAAVGGPSVRLDLTQLAGVDAAGIRMLRRLQKDGARLTGASPYVELLLERAGQVEEGESK